MLWIRNYFSGSGSNYPKTRRRKNRICLHTGRVWRLVVSVRDESDKLKKLQDRIRFGSGSDHQTEKFLTRPNPFSEHSTYGLRISKFAEKGDPNPDLVGSKIILAVRIQNRTRPLYMKLSSSGNLLKVVGFIVIYIYIPGSTLGNSWVFSSFYGQSWLWRRIL